MLAKMTPAEMDERIAAEVLEEEKRNRLAEILKLGFATVCAALNVKVPPDAFEPDDKRRAVVRQGTTTQVADDDASVVSPEVAAAQVVAVLGPPNRRKG